MSVRIALLVPLLAFGAGAAAAQGIDLSNGGPVQVNAAGGIDWQQNQQEIIAHGDARATRGNVTVTATRLIAFYRKKAQTTGQGSDPQPVQAPAASAAPDDSAGTEVYRLEAVGDVHIFTPTDQAFGDHAVYDMDQSVLVLTGQHLKLITPQDVLTARDSVEYWPQRHMAVARGEAVVVTNDARRISADILVAYTVPGQGNPAPPGQGSPAPGAVAAAPITPVAATTPAKPPADPLMASGKLQRVEAYGNVDVRTVTETVYGDRGVYVPDTGRARVVGRVRITRGQNQLNGNAADVNMKTGVATLVSGAAERVRGLIVPSDAQNAGKQPVAKAAAPAAAKPVPPGAGR